MAYVDFPDGLEGQKKRKAFWLSEDGCQLIAGWRRRGIALTTIAEEYIGVSKTGFWNWYRESEDLRKACAVAKDIADYSVEDALYRKAIGYDYWEEIWELIEGEIRLTRKMKKHMPPDVKAALAWLYNRLPADWRSIQEPLESTQYADSVRNILIAMKEVAEKGGTRSIEMKEDSKE